MHRDSSVSCFYEDENNDGDFANADERKITPLPPLSPISTNLRK